MPKTNNVPKILQVHKGPTYSSAEWYLSKYKKMINYMEDSIDIFLLKIIRLKNVD